MVTETEDRVVAQRWVVGTPGPLRARVLFELRDCHLPFTTFHPDAYTAMDRASITHRLELWVGCVPVEFSQHPRPQELAGLVVAATRDRAVMIVDPDKPEWLDDMAKAVLYDQLPAGEWNDPVCPRCRCDATVRTDEGLWWCGRHATRAWEPVGHGERVSWQQQRMVG